MKISGKYTMLFIEGFFIKDLSCYSDGTKKISECREGVLGALLKEDILFFFALWMVCLSEFYFQKRL